MKDRSQFGIVEFIVALVLVIGIFFALAAMLLFSVAGNDAIDEVQRQAMRVRRGYGSESAPVPALPEVLRVFRSLAGY